MTQLALIVDLNLCVGCNACVVSCNEWNASDIGCANTTPDLGAEPREPVAFNRVHTYEIGTFPDHETLHLPKNCLHCEDPPCVPVCPTGASFKRQEDGIVLVDYDKCIGCKYCTWACPYGAREFDEQQKVVKKCTLCVDRIYDQTLPKNLRQPACVLACPTQARLFGDIKDSDSLISRTLAKQESYQPMPEWHTKPAGHYLLLKKIVNVFKSRLSSLGK